MATPITIRDIGASSGGQITLDAAAANMEYVNTGNLILIVRNASASPVTVTIQGAPEPLFGRDVDKVAVIAAAATGVFGPMKPAGFNQQSGVNKGKVLVDFSATATITVGVYRIHP